MICLLLSSLLLKRHLLQKNVGVFSHIAKENEEAMISSFTTVCGSHHSSTVVLAGNDFLLFSCSVRIVAHGCLWGRSKYT